MTEALYYQKKNKVIHCQLCPHACLLREGQTGRCRGRTVQQGRLITLTYGEIVSIALDPIEKKPLYHFYPGSFILSTGPNACNLVCNFCQNWSISQQKVTTQHITIRRMIDTALTVKSIGIAFTYTEPLMMYEFILEAAPQIRQAGLKTVLVTNGYINPEPMKQLLPWIDAMNIDLKGFSESFYQKYTGGHLKPVLETISLAQAECLVELTCLLIPGYNDQEEEIRAMAEWIAGLNPDLPLHFSRYYPHYQCNQPVTSLEHLQRAHLISSSYLRYVYLGNISPDTRENSYCYWCGKLLIQRQGWHTQIDGLTPDGHCEECGSVQHFILSAR